MYQTIFYQTIFSHVQFDHWPCELKIVRGSSTLHNVPVNQVYCLWRKGFLRYWLDSISLYVQSELTLDQKINRDPLLLITNPYMEYHYNQVNGYLDIEWTTYGLCLSSLKGGIKISRPQKSFETLHEFNIIIWKIYIKHLTAYTRKSLFRIGINLQQEHI